MFIDPDTYYTHDLSPKVGKEAFQAAGTARPGSRLDTSVWVYGQAPASDKSQESVMVTKRGDNLSSLWLLTRSLNSFFFFFFFSYTVQALLCLVKHKQHFTSSRHERPIVQNLLLVR